jgi:hypothetical protein
LTLPTGEAVDSPRIICDASRWPLVEVTWPTKAVSDEEFQRAVGELSAFSHRKQRFVTLHRAIKAARPTPNQRAFAAKQQAADAPVSRRWLCGVAVVVNSPLLAGVVTAINWLIPSPYPLRTFSSLNEAKAWLDTRLADKG